MVPCPATLRRRRLIVDAEVLVILFIVYGGAGRLRASLSEYGGAAMATEKKAAFDRSLCATRNPVL
jgi:hypothetical protein